MIDSWSSDACAGIATIAIRTSSRAVMGANRRCVTGMGLQQTGGRPGRPTLPVRTRRYELSCGEALLRRVVALGDLVPVDDVPPRLEVVGTLVLVLEVVGVLPDVVAQQRHL